MASKKNIRKIHPKGKSFVKDLHLKEKIRNILPIITFLGIFIIILGAYYLFITSELRAWLNGYIEFTARLAAFIMKIFDNTIITNGTFISNAKYSINVGFGCDGLDPMMVFFAGIAGVPVAIKYKIPGIILGIISLYLLNIFRIILLFIIGMNNQELFQQMHLEILPIVYIILSISLLISWYYWLSIRLRKNEHETKIIA
jgi:exosortase/archaeosortase family protein